MDFLQLKYFRELAYSQHVTELAEKLHISQPSLSITISKLEKELGIKLFDIEKIRKFQIFIHIIFICFILVQDNF
ncbi:MAG: hypothetical protein B6I29_02090 [Marinitoga sp. 4572_148]|nr:MAG: hypothetical protein B6I29_02090 [Marinitoga sp. 4572_148]